jgi:hypothetical protein
VVFFRAHRANHVQAQMSLRGGRPWFHFHSLQSIRSIHKRTGIKGMGQRGATLVTARTLRARLRVHAVLGVDGRLERERRCGSGVHVVCGLGRRRVGRDGRRGR